MKRQFTVFLSLILALAALTLYGCGSVVSQPDPTQGAALEATQEPTPEPTVAILTIAGQEYSPKTRELTLASRDALAELLEKKADFESLQQIHLSETPEVEDLAALKAAFPAAELSYPVILQGRTLSPDVKTLDLTALTAQDIPDAVGALSLLPELESVSLSPELSVDDYIALKQAAPAVQFAYSFELYGQTVTTETESLAYANVGIGNEGVAEFHKVLPYLDRLNRVSFEYCGIDDETMAELRDAFPDKEIVWRVIYGWASSWSDTIRIWAIGGFSDKQLESLKYCTKVKYLDLGHNGIYELDFVRYMPDLEVLILENDYVSDLSDLATCKKLEYLEVGETQVTDVSPLAECTSLEHLNIGGLLGLTDISPLYNLPNLKRFYGLCDVNVPREQVEYVKSIMPNTEVDFDYYPKGAVNGSHWRYEDGGGLVPRYQLLHDQIGYDW